MSNRIYWFKIDKKHSYIPSDTIIQMWNKRWPFGVCAGIYSESANTFYRMDGTSCIKLFVPPSHWRSLSNPPVQVMAGRKPWLAHQLLRVERSKAKYDQMFSALRDGLTWQQMASKFGYKNVKNCKTVYVRLIKRFSGVS